ncbi:DUF1289 domain-containing protein [Sphingopyxis macrogoltabida]|uniref:DUF1289 domain-containing protein n=1 Tax=Sphingopyxis macrogoltabida TaxID=33050 RepID=UPI0011EA6D6C|nr:DUF1289 domain-containing protein [Sphingopyxis macrogoltabida]
MTLLNRPVLRSARSMRAQGGCTAAEIGEWGGATAERQCAILALLPERMAQLAAGQPVMLQSSCSRPRRDHA